MGGRGNEGEETEEDKRRAAGTNLLPEENQVRQDGNLKLYEALSQ